jgi:hypothetical protein
LDARSARKTCPTVGCSEKTIGGCEGERKCIASGTVGQRDPPAGRPCRSKVG